MNIRDAIKNLLLTGCLALVTPTYAATNAPAHVYPSGAEIAEKIGNDLVATLDPKFQKMFDPEAVSLKQSEAPVIAPVCGTRHGPLCQVAVSTGFIDLINHIAHAKAIDRIQPGYLNHYIAQLSQQGPNENPAQLPGWKTRFIGATRSCKTKQAFSTK